MQTIHVQTQPSYDVLVGKGLLAQVGKRIAREIGRTHLLVVTSKTVSRLHGAVLRSGLALHPKVTWIELPDGERVKDLRTLGALLEQFARAGVDRESCVVAFGGGSVGDLAGLAASLYMRGLPVIQIPTTLLAQVDASVGGKTAINLAHAKNLVGTFHQPRAVIADLDVLFTLKERDFRAGIFEVIKCGAIRHGKLLSLCENDAEKILKRDEAVLQRIIAAAAAVKAEIVAKDERESDLRRILNFGHTIGHALEAAGNYRKLLHGEAVALGMIAAAEIGVNTGVTPADVGERLIACILQFGPLPEVRFPISSVLRAMSMDKKTIRSRPHFVLLKAIGQTVVRNDIPERVIRESIRSVTA